MVTPPSREMPGRHLGALDVGRTSVEDLRAELDAAGVRRNESAEHLLGRDEVVLPAPTTLELVSVTVAALGLTHGGRLPEIFAAAVRAGLDLCPLATAPYLRLRHRERESKDPELRRQRPPDGALHVASAPVSTDVGTPKGFYLRTVGGVLWLRGYRCDDEYLMAPTAAYVFALPSSPGAPALAQ